MQKEKWRRRETAIVLSVLVMAAALWTIFAVPAISATSDGTYVRTAETLKLCWIDNQQQIG